MVSAIKKAVTSSRISATRHPKASDMVAEIEGMSGQAPTVTELDQLRQIVRRDVANPRAEDAEKFFGDKKHADEIYKVNRKTIGSNHNALKVGMKIDIPAK